jgi:heme exporter protein D
MNISEFLAMGGYGFYVWSAYGICAVILLLLAWQPIRQRRQLLRQLQLKRLRNAE